MEAPATALAVRELYPVKSSYRVAGDPNILDTQLRTRACFLACKSFSLAPFYYIETYYENIEWNATNMNLFEKINPDKYLIRGYKIYGQIGKKITFHAREGTDPTVAIADDPIGPVWEDQKIKNVFHETIHGWAALKKMSRIDLEFVNIRVIEWDSPASNGSPCLGFEIICKVSRTGEQKLFRTVDEKIYMINNENLGTFIPLPKPITPVIDGSPPSRMIETIANSNSKWSLPWPFSSKKEKK